MKTTKADEKALLEAESRYCSYGDTVHYLEPAKLFAGCNGSFLYDYEDKPYLDLQMWYSAVNFGYANPRLNDALKRQIDTLPQVASQYLHREKIELAAMLCESIKDAWGEEGRVHFNVGGSQAIEDSLKLVRNACGGKSLMIAFEGGYHGRTLGASSITSSYRYRRRYGHFGERALFVPFPYCFRCPYGKRRDDCGMFCADQFERLFETEYYGVWDPKAGEAEYAAFYVECIQGTGGYVVPPDGYYQRLKKVLDERKIMLVVTRQTVLCTTPFSFGMKKLGKSILWHTVCINKKAGACSRLFVYAVFIRSAAILAYSGESSMPTHLLPVAFAARAVEPPPRKGSSTVPPSGTTPMSSAMSGIGLLVRWTFSALFTGYLKTPGRHWLVFR